MKVGTLRFVVVAVIAGLVATVGVTPMVAQITFTNFSSTTGLTINPSAAQSGNVLRLTSAIPNQAGSAWFNTLQPVTGGFSTSFTFQITGSPPNQGVCTSGGFCPGDGIAFVIQNSSGGVNALGPAGCGIGFGDSSSGCAPPAGGISNSLAVEFDTYQNTDDPSNNHVSIQSCLTAANSRDSSCSIRDNPNVSPTIMSDGNVHSVTITYKPGTPSGCGESHASACPSTIDVILDNTDLFPGNVPFDLTSIGLGGTKTDSAYVGFTAATGGAFNNHDILSWTFTPQAQSAAVAAGGAPVALDFQGGTGNGAYNYTAQLQSFGAAPSATVNINPILMDQKTCNKLVQKSFPLTQCFVYQNAGKDINGNSVDAAVLFELTCPGSSSGGTCGDIGPANFFADLGSNFTFTKAENPGYQLLASTIGPYPGWLKGSGLDPLHPCTPNPNGTTPLFASNQISSFSVVGDPLGTTKGKSGGGGSCWVTTFFTAGELPPGVKVSSPTFTTYNKGAVVTASYTCSNPKTTKVATNATGPYLTVASCSQSQTPNTSNQTQATGCVPGNACTGGVDTATKGLHAFTVTSKDSGGNVGANIVIYNVK